MELGERDGFGFYGQVTGDEYGLQCHECGHTFTHLGLHAYRAHGVTADQYRQEHGLRRRQGLVVSGTSEKMRQNAAASLATKTTFLAHRDPGAASAVSAAKRSSTAAGRAAPAANGKPGRGRLGIVIECLWCGALFCPPSGARRRTYCSKRCAGQAARAASRTRP